MYNILNTCAHVLTHPLQYGQFLCFTIENCPFACTRSTVYPANQRSWSLYRSRFSGFHSLVTQWKQKSEGTMTSRHTGV